MPKRAKEMRPLQIRKLTKPGCHAVGGVVGLYLQVTPTGAKSWLLRIVVGAKRRELGLGSFPSVSLELARDRARNMRAKVEAGIDPAAERKAMREALRAATRQRTTFKEAAEQFLTVKCAELKSDKHKSQWRASLEQYAYPTIGSKALSEITVTDLLSVLEPIWLEKTATASKVRNRIENVLNWAKAKGYLDGDNVARWGGNLELLLATPSKVVKVEHRAALSGDEMPVFMAKLRKLGGLAPRALEMLVLSGLRTAEVRLAEWKEFDFESMTWTIPANRMKGGREHTVPVTRDMKRLLDSLPRAAGGYVFERASGRPLGETAIYNVVKKRMESTATPHGFRSTFKDWCRASCPNVPDEVSELVLAHVASDATRAAYARDGLLEQRRELLEAWAAHCNGEAVAQSEAA